MLICHFSFQNITNPNWENHQVNLRLSICHQIEGYVTINQLFNLLFGANKVYWLVISGHLLLPDSSSAPIISESISSKLDKVVGVIEEVTLLLLTWSHWLGRPNRGLPQGQDSRAQAFPKWDLVAAKSEHWDPSTAFAKCTGSSPLPGGDHSLFTTAWTVLGNSPSPSAPGDNEAMPMTRRGGGREMPFGDVSCRWLTSQISCPRSKGYMGKAIRKGRVSSWLHTVLPHT